MTGAGGDMMGEFEAIGDLVTGSMAGRAAEASAGEPGADGHTHERNCLNCGTLLAGDYCHSCGQHAHVHRTLTAFLHDFMHGVLHFEGKTWRTLPLLAWRPGELTRNYIDGQRARFVSPIALFLFSVFLMLAVLGMTGALNAPDTSGVREEMSTNVAKDEAKLRVAEGERAKLAALGKSTAAVDKRIKSISEELQLERTMAANGLVKGSAMRVSDDVPAWLRGPAERAGKNPELLLYKVKSNAYKWSWAVIPLSVPFLWLLFPFSRRFRLYDHIVFVTYSLCFMTLLVCVVTLIGVAGLAPVAGLAILIPPIHIYRQLRGAYGLGWFGALWRAAVLVVVAMTVMALFVMGLVGVGLFD
jgi:hypothetical protein